MNAELILGEIEVMKSLDHPNLIKMCDIYQTPNNFYLLLEYCEQGDLEQRIRRGVMSEQETISIMKQVVNGYDHIF